MDIISNDNSEESILGFFPNDNSQRSDFQGRDDDFQYYDNTYIEKEIINNANLEHRNFIKVIEFAINRNSCGPYFFGVQFNAKYFMNIIREYYLKLNCQRLNFIVSDRIIYIYGHYNQNLKIYTKINTHYIHPDLVKIIEGYSKEFRANFDVSTLLKHLELHNFTNKENLKMFFAFNPNHANKSKKRERNLNSIIPFEELQAQQSNFNYEFNFEESAIPGNIIIETQKFKCNIESNFAPLELSSPPKIPPSIFTDFILSISIDKLGSAIQKMNPLKPLEIYCNHYICNFISNVNVENFLTYENNEGIQFKHDNAINFCKKCDDGIDESIFYQKMINFTLRKHELDALKIINKKTLVIHFYAGKKEKYYFSKETDQEGNITSAIILCSDDNKPLIKNIEDCCAYSDHWAEWLSYLVNILPKDCINELEKKRKLKERFSNDNDEIINASTNNKKNRKKIKEVKKNGNSNNNIKNSSESSTNEFTGLYLYANDKKGNLKKINIEESKNNIEIRDIGREENINNNNNDKEKNEENNSIINPFEIK